MEPFFAGAATALGATNIALVIYVLRRLENRIDRLEKKLDDIKDAVAKTDKDLAVHIAQPHHPPPPVPAGEILRVVQ